MPVEANASIRVNVPELKAEIEIECLPHNSFWHLKLCLVDGILLKGSQRADESVRPTTRKPPLTATSTANGRQKRPPFMQLVAKGLTARKADKIGNKSRMPTETLHASLTSCSIGDRRHRATNGPVIAPALRCHSSASSLSSTDASRGSLGSKQRDQVIYSRSHSQGRVPSPSSPAFYYGFTGVGNCAWDGSESNDLGADEEAAVQALIQAAKGYSNSCNAASDTASTIGNHNEYSTGSTCQHDDQANNRRISDLVELDERSDDDEYNIYECLRFGKLASEDHSFESKLADSGNSSVHRNTDDDNISDRFGKLDMAKAARADRRLFEQILASGYLNYGFYSFSLAKFIDDQTSLTEYLTLVSSSTGSSYYLDLEFKLKQRPQLSPLATSRAYSPAYNGNAHYALRLTTSGQVSLSQTHSRVNVVNRLSYSGANTHPEADVISLKLSRLPSLSSLHSRIKRTNSISTIGTNESRASQGSSINIVDQQNFTNNMIAKLASGGASSNKSSSSGAQATKNASAFASAAAASSASSSQCKRKRQKLLDLLINTNWSKQSQQAANLIKLNKVLLVCDANFLDERTGESPLSLAITSSQINATPTAANSANRLQPGAGHALASSAIGCTQSASLFNLQFQHPSASNNQLTLQQTSAADISQSKAPLVEKILLLLIKSGALIDFRNNDGRTPLHMAAMKSNSWALKTLLDQGASTDYLDINGLTPLYYSILHRAELKVTQLLLNHMSNKSLSVAGGKNGAGSKAIGICDQQGWQEVHHACKLGLDAHLDKLLYYGCDMDAKISGSGNTPLHVAAINDQLQVAKVLLLRGANRSTTNNSHQTAHQVAVISNNMDLAEFIASHDEQTVVPFAERPPNRHSFISSSPHITNEGSRTSKRLSMQSNQHLISSQSSNQISSNLARIQPSGQAPTVIVQPLGSHDVQSSRLDPLTLDVACHYSNGGCSAGSSGPSTSTSGTGHHTAQSSLLSINSSSQNHHLDAPGNNISPALSQRSCGTSNTTSSGVCCDAEGNNSDSAAGLKTHQSNITVISIDNANNSTNRHGSVRGTFNRYAQSDGMIDPLLALDSTCKDASSRFDPAKSSDNPNHDENRDEDDLSSSESSSSNGLYSLMSTNRPLFVGSIVEATTDYQSGDPSHLQLRREDILEVLEYPADLLQAGQLPRLANKPMLYGRRQTDGTCGLFPSFCVRRAKHRRASLRQRIPLSDLTNSSSVQLQQHTHNANGATAHANEQPLNQAIRGTNLPESQSMAAIGELEKQHGENSSAGNMVANPEKLSFREYQVVLTKINDGFGFVLRGARINPATLSAQSSVSNGRIAIDERLMIANNLASLQYLDDIEIGSVAQEAGLKRGDFLIAVNNQDVRLCSHENVVQMIRSSGDRVHLTIATPVVSIPTKEIYSSRTLTRVKPEPPKRDPTTTLTRNKSQKIKSMSVAPQIQRQQQIGDQAMLFDADKPLPRAPANQISSTTGSVAIDRSGLVNTSQFNSTTSLSSAAPDAQSLTSISTVSSVDNQRNQLRSDFLSPLNQNLDQSSSSTATLTTVATTKPEVLTKPSSFYMKGVSIGNPSTQSNYQPAAVMTSNRQKVQEQVEPRVTQKLSSKSTGMAQPSQLPAPPPPLPISLPPPPPPLPNFGNTENTLCLNQRRTSAPTNQLPSLDNANRLLKKRESLAVVNTDRQPNPAPICAVAAACAAAANSRLQRQQQRQQNEADQKQSDEPIKAPGVQSSEPSPDAKPKVPKEFDQDTKTHENVEFVAEFSSQLKTNHSNDEAKITKPDVSLKREQVARVLQSATLGRKSSAQIIQQPKQQQCPAHSQTLRAVNTPKRMSILDYEMSQLPPPPPIPVQQVSTRHIIHEMKPNPQPIRQIDHSHHNIAEENLGHHSVLNRSQHELAQRQLQNHQHQLILRQSQQIRQQQLIQGRLMSQQQAQHRTCQHSHATSAGREYGERHSCLAAEPADVPNHIHNHHHPHPNNHRKQQHPPISMEAQSYLVNQHYDQHNHNHAPVLASAQHYHHQQPHIKQGHQQHNRHRQAPSANHYSSNTMQPTPYHTHRHGIQIQHDRSQMLHQHHQQHQKLLQQQQQQQYLQYVESMPYIAGSMNR